MDAVKFKAGDSGPVQVCVQNNKTVSKIEAAAFQANLSQNYGAAVGLIASLDQGSAPFSIKTDHLLLGTLAAGQTTPPVPVYIEVEDDAEPGVYTIKVTLLKSTELEDSETLFAWSAGTFTQNISVEIEEEDRQPEFAVTDIDASLNQGDKTEVKVTFKNISAEIAEDAIVRVSASSPLSLTDNTAYLGDLRPGESAEGVFGLKVAGDALPKEYSLDAVIQYVDSDGDDQTSDRMKVPVPVNAGQVQFASTRTLLTSGLIGAVAIGAIWTLSSQVSRRRNRNR
jgi:hypothetical protein